MLTRTSHKISLLASGVRLSSVGLQLECGEEAAGAGEPTPSSKLFCCLPGLARAPDSREPDGENKGMRADRCPPTNAAPTRPPIISPIPMPVNATPMPMKAATAMVTPNPARPRPITPNAAPAVIKSDALTPSFSPEASAKPTGFPFVYEYWLRG